MLRAVSGSRLLILLSCMGLIGVGIYWSITDTIYLQRPELSTGYLLLTVMVLPSLFGIRKRLSMIPMGSMAFWTRLHVAIGITLVPLYWLHVGQLWPSGYYEQALALLFYLVTFSGIAGWIIQKQLPRRLTQAGDEIQFERITAAVIQCREQVEQLLKDYQLATGSDTLAQHYVETLSWYFFKPRFLLNHLVGGAYHEYWWRAKTRAIERYLGDNEKPFLADLLKLAERKANIDLHYTLQGVLKLWLFIHIPAVSSLVLVILWHVALVHIYSV